MPCDTISLQSVDLVKAMPSLLKEALKALGWSIIMSTPTMINATHNISGSSLVWTAGQGLRGYVAQQQVTQLMKAYSQQAVTWAAQRAGWTIKRTAADKLTMSRR